jgi:hypothetical protein
MSAGGETWLVGGLQNLPGALCLEIAMLSNLREFATYPNTLNSTKVYRFTFQRTGPATNKHNKGTVSEREY